MRKLIKTGFFWQFVGGFAIGAVGVLTLHPASAEQYRPATPTAAIVQDAR